MEYIGRVDNKETLAGYMEDGRRVNVQALSVFDAAPKEERHKPEYWAARCDTGEFANPEADPLVWIERENGERQYYAPTISREQATLAYYTAQERNESMTMQELLDFSIKQRGNLDAGSVLAIGLETVISALRKASPQEALTYLAAKRQLNATGLALYEGERANWELASLMRRLLGKRVGLYIRVISQIKRTPEYQESSSSPKEAAHS